MYQSGQRAGIESKRRVVGGRERCKMDRSEIGCNLNHHHVSSPHFYVPIDQFAYHDASPPSELARRRRMSS